MSMGSSQPTNQMPQGTMRVKMPDRKPIVTFALIGLTTVVFLIQFLVQTITGNDLLFIYGGKINELILIGQVWRLITPVLLHGSILHLGMNMYGLYILGRGLEMYYGHGRFLLLYLLSAFAGNVLSFVLTEAPSLGASTAVFGLLAARAVFIYQNRKLYGQNRTRQAIVNLVMVLLINLAYGFMSSTRIDNMGHIGGFLGGIFFAWMGGPLLRISGQPPFFDIVDVRKGREITLASLAVLIGFIIIASIPFFAP